MTLSAIGGYAQPPKAKRQHYFIRHTSAPTPEGVVSLCNQWALESAVSLSAAQLETVRLCSGCHAMLNLSEINEELNRLPWSAA